MKANIGLSVPWTEMTEQKFDEAVNEVSPRNYYNRGNILYQISIAKSSSSSVDIV